MKNEAAFSRWLQKVIMKHTNNRAICQRIETVTSNGVPDLTVILESDTLFIETKFQTKVLRPEQNAWAFRFKNVAPDHASCLALAAYPKTKRLIDIHEDTEYELSADGLIECLCEYTDTTFYE